MNIREERGVSHAAPAHVNSCSGCSRERCPSRTISFKNFVQIVHLGGPDYFVVRARGARRKRGLAAFLQRLSQSPALDRFLSPTATRATSSPGHQGVHVRYILYVRAKHCRRDATVIDRRYRLNSSQGAVQRFDLIAGMGGAERDAKPGRVTRDGGVANRGNEETLLA